MDEHGNLVPGEGMVTKPSRSGKGYMVSGTNRIVCIHIAPGDAWWVDPANAYVETPDRILLAR